MYKREFSRQPIKQAVAIAKYIQNKRVTQRSTGFHVNIRGDSYAKATSWYALQAGSVRISRERENKTIVKDKGCEEKEPKEIENALRYDHFLSSKPWRLENFAIR